MTTMDPRGCCASTPWHARIGGDDRLIESAEELRRLLDGGAEAAPSLAEWRLSARYASYRDWLGAVHHRPAGEWWTLSRWVAPWASPASGDRPVVRLPAGRRPPGVVRP
jgi:hypothetical protein